MILFACYLDLVQQKLLRFFNDKIDPKKQFCKNRDRVLLQPLVMWNRTRFNTIFKLHIAFFVYSFKKVLKTLRRQEELAKKKLQNNWSIP